MNSDIITTVFVYSGLGFILALDAFGLFSLCKYLVLGIKKLAGFIKTKRH